MPKISLCMVIHNGEKTLPRVFSNTKGLVDEIVVFDQGSTDETKEVCEKWDAYYHLTTKKGLADIDRQDCYNIANHDMILAMDDDEKLDARTKKFIASIHNDERPLHDIYWFKFKNLVNGVDIKAVLGDDWHPRLWRRADPPILIWPTTAHTFPKIDTQFQFFSHQGYFEHIRSLAKIRAVTEERRDTIDPDNQQLEAQFLKAVENVVLNGRKRKN